jgi:amino acid transporter
MSFASGSTAEADAAQNNVMAPAVPTTGYTWLIIVGALAALWFLGGVTFRSIRL